MNNISACGRTDVGIKRQRNEDNYVVEPDYGLFVVADGMGGHAGGDMASSMAIETVRTFIKKALSDIEITWPFGLDHSLPREINIISSGMRLANRQIFNEATGMGTTMVILLIRDDKAYICHVGDSRLYRIRNSTITQLTEDHSLVAEELRRGAITKEQARNYSLRHVITRAIGTSIDIRCDCMVENVMGGDMFLLCSDGLSGMLEDSDILNLILEQKSRNAAQGQNIKESKHQKVKDSNALTLGHSDANAGSELPNFSPQASRRGDRTFELLEECCERLIKKANEKGGDDNITAILVTYK